MRVLHLVGARPNFVKIAPLLRALARLRIEQRLVHSGQHYDDALNGRVSFDLDLPPPDVHLGIGSGSHAEQTARVLLALEPVLAREAPDLLVVAGDVNTTVAGALTAAKLGIPVAHVEAGLRCFDRSMPEEINRVVTDALSTLLLTPSPEARRNLEAEGIAPGTIHFVGNLMIDSLVANLEAARALRTDRQLGLEPGRFCLVTLHRPSNVDDPERLGRVVEALRQVARAIPTVFVLHPRTRARLAAARLLDRVRAVPWLRLVDALGYRECLGLVDSARLVVTDSGGLQEETTFLGVPCLTFRPSTERPVTVTSGTNRVIGDDPDVLPAAVAAALPASRRTDGAPDLWDGQAAVRAADVIARWGGVGAVAA